MILIVAWRMHTFMAKQTIGDNMCRAVLSLAVLIVASATVLSRADVREPSMPPSHTDRAIAPSLAASGEDSRAVALIQAGALDEAITNLSRAIQLNPTSATAILYRACAYRAKGAFEQSLQDWDHYIQLNPTNDFAYKSRASLYNVTGRFDRAIKDWNEGLRLTPADATALAMRGFAYSKTGQYQKALNDFTEALRLEPDNHSAHNSLAWLRATCPDPALRDGSQAVQEATKACELTSRTNWTRVDTLAAAFAEAGQFKKAVAAQRRAIRMTGPSTDDLRGMHERLSLYQHGKPFHEGQR